VSAPAAAAGQRTGSGPGSTITNRPRTALWSLGAGAVAAALVAPLWFGPLVPLALVAAGIAVAATALVPQLAVAGALALVVVSTPLSAAVGGVAGSLDDAAVIFCAVALPLRALFVSRRLVWLPGGGWFAGYVLAGLLSAVAQDVPTGTALQGAFLAVKALLLAFAAAQVSWTTADLRRAVRVGAVVAAVMVLTGAANLAAPGAWSSLIGSPQSSGPFGLPELTGIFARPAAYSRFCGVLALGALAYALVVRGRALAWGVFAACAALAVLTLQVKSLLGLLATTAVIAGPFLLRRRGAVVLAGLPLVALVAAPTVYELVVGDVDRYVLQVSARSLLTEGGIAVAAATFPFGAGFGQYASYTASEQYSPWYYRLGFEHRYGMGPGPDSGQFLNDTQWPAIYGEAGWIGGAFFAAGVACMLVFLLRQALRRQPWHTDPLDRWLAVWALGALLLLLVESAAAPVFVSAPASPFAFIGVGVVAALRARRDDGQPSEEP
jgi:hypothetical protein